MQAEAMQFNVIYEFQVAKNIGQIFVRKDDPSLTFEPIIGPNLGFNYNALVFEHDKSKLIIIKQLEGAQSTAPKEKFGYNYWKNIKAKFILTSDNSIQMIPYNREEIPEAWNPIKIQPMNLKEYQENETKLLDEANRLHQREEIKEVTV